MLNGTDESAADVNGYCVSGGNWSLRWVGPAHVAKSRRRLAGLRISVVCILALALLTYALVDALGSPARRRTGEGRLVEAKSVLVATSQLVNDTEKLLRLTISGPNAEEGALKQLSSELAVDRKRLAKAKRGLEADNLSVMTLDTCVSGVQQAVSDMKAGGQNAAIDVITSVASPCESLVGNSPGGPVYPFDFPDPDVIDVSGTYFAYATNSAVGNIQIITSSDLLHWTPIGNALPKLASWASPGYTWAPGVLDLGGSYLLYYAVLDGSKECISVAEASQPEGPFIDYSTAPLVCQRSLGGSIDPSPYTDESGNHYLTWKSNGGGGHPATIWAQALAPSGTSMAAGSTPTALLQPSQPWEGSNVEAPDMWLEAGTYYLFYSGNDWSSSSYAEGVAKCQGPLGPCSKPLDRPIYASQPNLVSPGGGSVFADSQGNTWIAFHAYLPDAVGYPSARLLFLRRLTFSGGAPQVEPPS